MQTNVIFDESTPGLLIIARRDSMTGVTFQQEQTLGRIRQEQIPDCW